MEAKPTYADVMQCVEQVSRCERFVRSRVVGRSVQGRDIPIVELTDNTVPDDDKQLVVFACGTHGSEEAGRAAGMALMEWLSSGKPYVTLRNQKIVVLPCVNPDGSVANSYHNAQDVNVYTSYMPLAAEPSSHEGRVVYEALRGMNPSLVVDIHGLAGGAMCEEFYCHNLRPQGPGNFLLLKLCEEVRQAAEAAGFPQREPHLEDLPALPSRFAGECHSFGLTMETTENYYPLHLMVESQMVRLRALLSLGDRWNYFHAYRGYPCEAIAGNAMTWLCAHGTTAAARGENRRQLMATVPDMPSMFRKGADPDSTATVVLQAARDLDELPRWSLQARIHKPCRIREVRYGKEELPPGSETHGYVVREDAASQIVRVNLDRSPRTGDNVVTIRYDVKW